MPLREARIAPAFFIGLGGAGGAIVDELARKVKQEESFERYRDLIHFFALDTDASEEQLATLLRLTERYCVVYQTLRQPPTIAITTNTV